ncbi:MAG: PilZ domain-containing protein [Hyphomicrobium sp.]|jgi:hypothetical protein|nr:PilZ domain-containing protein [Hyphomicrobium sp.]
MINDIDVCEIGDSWLLRRETGSFSPLLEKLVTDTQSTALLTAATTSAVNAMRQPGVVHTPSELQSYLPDANGMVFAMRVLERQSQCPLSATAAVSTFVASLDPALGEMERYFADANLIGIERAVALHQFSLANIWRRAAYIGAQAVAELAQVNQACLPSLYELSAGILGRLLNAAAQGQSPCLMANGQPFLPALPQRRRAARRILGQPATVTLDGNTQRVYARDVSQGGIGLEQVEIELPVGEIAVVALSTGRHFAGSVVWNKARRAGISLTVPLAPNDPLLWG